MRDKKAHVSVTYCCITNNNKSFWLQKNNLIFLMILLVLPELIHVAADSWWLCWGWLVSGGLTHMGGASAAEVGMDGWTAGPLFPLSPQASSLESSCCLRWQKQGLWGLTSLPRSCHILLVKWVLRPAQTNSEERDHLQMEGAGNSLWPFKIHQHLQTGLSLCYLVSCVFVTF